MDKQVRIHFFLISAIILATSWTVWRVNVSVLQHARNFYRALNYHILQHETFGVYWFGQTMVNYPINQYYLLADVQDFMIRMNNKMGNLDLLAYGTIDQHLFNQTTQNIQIHYRNGNTQSIQWSVTTGLPPESPFQFDNLPSIKAVLTQTERLLFIFQNVDLGAGHIWDITYHPYEDVSVFVRIEAHQKINLASEHVFTLVGGLALGILVLWQFFFVPNRRTENLLYCMVSVMLVGTAILAFSGKVKFEIIFIFDGITCCATWLCAIRFYLRSDDYNLTFLLGQSYSMIGWLFASFGPLMIAFAMFGYVVFSRYSGQFSSLWRTFLSLFYICYYNMTYESAMVTSRSNPISIIFFIVFVLLFTICVYSGMLVSIFCSYVWRKRQLQIRKDIQNNLRIQCSNCDHKYRYIDTKKQKPKTSFNLSEYLDIDFKNPQGRQKYKRIMTIRIQRLRQNVDHIIQENTQTTNRLPISIQRQWRQELWNKTKYINNLAGS